MKKDYIELRGVKAHGFHGVFEEEKTQGQDFIVDVRLYVSLANAAENDDVTCTVNYAEVAVVVEEIIQGPSVDLIETLAEKVATACLQFEQVTAVRVKVHKPAAPMSVSFSDVSVSIYRKKS